MEMKEQQEIRLVVQQNLWTPNGNSHFRIFFQLEWDFNDNIYKNSNISTKIISINFFFNVTDWPQREEK